MKVSRPLIALLVVVVVFFAIWATALRSSVTGTPHGRAAPLTSAISAAHGAVNTANAASLAHGGTIPQAAQPGSGTTPGPPRPTTPATTPRPATGAGVTTASQTQTPVASRRAAHPAPRPRVLTAAGREQAVVQALRANEVIALLFYNPGGADDQAVRAELAGISVRGARILKLAVPLGELSRYQVVTNQVGVTQSPTLVLIDRAHQAHLLVGYMTGFELAQRITDALMGS